MNKHAFEAIYSFIVQSVRSILALLLVLFWVPLTSHCRLESVPGLDFLHCSSEGADSCQDNDACGGETCCEVEFSKYQLPRQQAFVPLLTPVFLLEAFVSPSLEPPARLVATLVPNPSPPDISALWRFSSRVALPVRAPSLLS